MAVQADFKTFDTLTEQTSHVLSLAFLVKSRLFLASRGQRDR